MIGLPKDEGVDTAGALVNIAANRLALKWTRREQAGRLLWALVYPLFRYSPRPFWRWRAFILRSFGASIGSGVHVYPTVAIAIPWNLSIGPDAAVGDGAILYSLGRIDIGMAATISQHAHLCAGTHDHRRSDMRLLKCPIEVGRGSWVCADAFVGPDVHIGDYAIVGARAVAVRDVEPWTIVAGNPARRVGRRSLHPR